MTWFNSARFSTRILLIVGLACSICAVVAVAVSIHFTDVEMREGIIEKSRTVHSRLAAATEYVALQGGLRSAIERVVQRHKDGGALSEDEKLEILKQVPIFAAMKIGANGADKEHYNFRVFSDEPRRKDNQATSSELEVFQKFARDPNLPEWIYEDKEKITVYRPVRLYESQGCLNCHGNPSTSPWGNGRDVLGFKMENWQDGKLHGVFAITTQLSEVKAAQASTQSVSNTTLLALFIVGGAFLSLLLSGYLIRGPISKLRQVALVLGDSSAQVGSAAHQIASSSEELSQATTQQAASLEETAASIEQMNSMVNKNSDNARQSAETSRESQSSAERGKEVVEQMIQAISDINTSNNHIMEQIDESNRQIEDIVKVISEIGNRTKVINDIVFQTKLLSFNASVEAARAGEHGKGFAVVAEEVGNLAQMSGNAAKEISSMLESSIQKVESIVQETKEKVQRLISEGKLKVETGTRVAEECGVVLNDIVRHVGSVTQMASEISTASQEQSQGVQEITKAMNQLDQVTQQNASTSEEVASAADQLSAQSESMKAIVVDLMTTIEGTANNSNLSSTPASSTPSERKVVAFNQKKRAPVAQAVAAPTKKASGEPDYNDPRFKDI